MSKTLDHELRRYYRTLWRRLPYIPKEKKKYLTSIQVSVNEFLSDHPSAEIGDIYQEIGSVQELCEEYKDNMTEEQLAQSVRLTKTFYYLLSFIAIILIVLCVFFAWRVHQSAPKDIYITLESTEL